MKNFALLLTLLSGVTFASENENKKINCTKKLSYNFWDSLIKGKDPRKTITDKIERCTVVQKENTKKLKEHAKEIQKNPTDEEDLNNSTLFEEKGENDGSKSNDSESTNNINMNDSSSTNDNNDDGLPSEDVLEDTSSSGKTKKLKIADSSFRKAQAYNCGKYLDKVLKDPTIKKNIKDVATESCMAVKYNHKKSKDERQLKHEKKLNHKKKFKDKRKQSKKNKNRSFDRKIY